jgi:hypothetical protein
MSRPQLVLVAEPRDREFWELDYKEQKKGLDCRHNITTNSNANGEQHRVARTKPMNWPNAMRGN